DQVLRSLQITQAFFDLPTRAEWFLVRHHWAHSNLAYYTSPFEDALVVCLDGTGCFADSGMVCVGKGDTLEPRAMFSNVSGPRFGLVYESLARRVFGGQFDTGKLLGLAGYGERIAEFKPVFQVIMANNRCRARNALLFDVVPER